MTPRTWDTYVPNCFLDISKPSRGSLRSSQMSRSQTGMRGSHHWILHNAVGFGDCFLGIQFAYIYTSPRMGYWMGTPSLGQLGQLGQIIGLPKPGYLTSFLVNEELLLIPYYTHTCSDLGKIWGDLFRESLNSHHLKTTSVRD